jgi:hypothetical protein
MTADDIKGLIDDARCINSCVPPGFQLPFLIALLFDASSGAAPTVPCVNLMPTDAIYDNIGTYTINPLLTVGASYKLTWGTNETALSLNGDPVLSPGVGLTTLFMATGNDVLLGSPHFSSVTAIICAV